MTGSPNSSTPLEPNRRTHGDSRDVPGQSSPGLSRRRFLKLAAVAGGTAAVGGLLWRGLSGPSAAASPGQGANDVASQLLSPSRYDLELGRRVGNDARLAVAGQLSDSEFYQKYHDAYVKEFGTDKRSLNTGRSTSGSNDLLQKRAQMGFVIDLERCTGCLACLDGCHRENNLSAGVHWMYVMAYEDENQADLNFLVRPCQHCSNPVCVKVCPVMARHKRESEGLVLTDYDLCIGCRYCEVSCPYGVNYFQWDTPRPDIGFMYSRTDIDGRRVNGNAPRGVMSKCTLCPQRQDTDSKSMTAACALACPHDVIHVGDINDPDSEPMRYLEKRRGEKGGSLSTFRLLEELGTVPNVIYIGQQPSRGAKQVTGPTTMEDWGWVDERRAVLEGPRPWFKKIFGAKQ